MRIVGGIPAPEARYPFSVAFVQGQFGDFQFCSGSLVAPNVVLTSKFCSFPLATTSALTNCVDVTPEINECDVLGILSFTDFVSADGTDARLYVLSEDATGDPVILAEPGFEVKVGQDVSVIGWGSSSPDNTEPNNLLREINIEIADSAACNAQIRDLIEIQFGTDVETSFDEVNIESEMCATGDENDICGNDFGSPMFLKCDRLREDVQVGIVTNTRQFGCGGSGIPRVYTKVFNPDVFSFIQAAVTAQGHTLRTISNFSDFCVDGGTQPPEIFNENPTPFPTFDVNGWTCAAQQFAAGDGCQCECGIPDPDCDFDNLPTNCPPGQRCVGGECNAFSLAQVIFIVLSPCLIFTMMMFILAAAFHRGFFQEDESPIEVFEIEQKDPGSKVNLKKYFKRRFICKPNLTVAENENKSNEKDPLVLLKGLMMFIIFLQHMSLLLPEDLEFGIWRDFFGFLSFLSLNIEIDLAEKELTFSIVFGVTLLFSLINTEWTRIRKLEKDRYYFLTQHKCRHVRWIFDTIFVCFYPRLFAPLKSKFTILCIVAAVGFFLCKLSLAMLYIYMNASIGDKHILADGKSGEQRWNEYLSLIRRVVFVLANLLLIPIISVYLKVGFLNKNAEIVFFAVIAVIVTVLQARGNSTLYRSLGKNDDMRNSKFKSFFLAEKIVLVLVVVLVSDRGGNSAIVGEFIVISIMFAITLLAICYLPYSTARVNRMEIYPRLSNIAMGGLAAGNTLLSSDGESNVILVSLLLINSAVMIAFWIVHLRLVMVAEYFRGKFVELRDFFSTCCGCCRKPKPLESVAVVDGNIETSAHDDVEVEAPHFNIKKDDNTPSEKLVENL